MNMRLLIAALGLITPAWFCGPAFAAPAVSVLEITPDVCVRSDASIPCNMRLHFSWHLNQAMAVCLFQIGQEHALYCAASDENTYTLDAELLSNTAFELRHADSGLALAVNRVEVATVIEQLRPRRRFGWGLF